MYHRNPATQLTGDLQLWWACLERHIRKPALWDVHCALGEDLLHRDWHPETLHATYPLPQFWHANSTVAWSESRSGINIDLKFESYNIP